MEYLFLKKTFIFNGEMIREREEEKEVASLFTTLPFQVKVIIEKGGKFF